MRFPSRPARHIAVVAILVMAASCGAPTSPTPPAALTGVLVGAGDIGQCGSGGMALTASLLDQVAGTVFTAGDNAYFSGTATEFANCYEPFWGRHKPRTRAVPGNHDYESPGAGPYFDYFGSAAGSDRSGYYSYTVGAWLVLALNSEADHSEGSVQMAWLRNQLAGDRRPCAAAIWHRPLFTSGRNLDNPDMLPVWRALYAADVDVIINGHDHMYERFTPQDPDGRPDPTRGIRQFTVGTGGAPLYQPVTLHQNSEVRAAAWGITVFTLNPSSYAWQFKPADGFSFADSGVGECH